MFVVGKGGREGHRTFAVGVEVDRGTRQRTLAGVPQFLAGLIQHRDPVTGQTSLGAVTAIPDGDPVNRLRGLEIHLPPGLVFLLGVGHRLIGEHAAGVAINRPVRGRPEIGAALAGLALEGDVVATGKHLNLGQVQKLGFAGQADPDIPALEAGGGGRHNRSADFRQHKVAAGKTRTTPGQFCIRQDIQSQAGNHLFRDRQIDRVGVGGRRLVVENRSVRTDRQRKLALRLHGRRTQRRPAGIQRQLRFPPGLGGQQGRRRLFEPGFDRGKLGLPGLADFALFGREHLMQRRFIAAVSVLGVVEDGEQAKVFLLRDRVVLVGVALGAGDRRAHPGGQGGVHTINDGDVAKLLIAGAALVVGHRVAVEGRGDQLFVGRLGQQVPRELFDGKLVERLVLVERLDHVIAIGPDRS